MLYLKKGFFAFWCGFLLVAGYSAQAVVKVCTTTSLIADLVEQVGGQEVKIFSLMGPGVDPHLYKATASDIRKLQQAEAVFYNGLHLEGRMTDVFESLARRKKSVFAVTNAIPKEKLLTLNADSSSCQADPHVWFDPRLWAFCANEIALRLSQVDPQHEIIYKANAQEFKKALDALRAWGQQRIEGLPLQKRILITSHDAYNYFGRAFDFQVIGVQGISTASEAGLADIVSMIDFIKANGVKAIFVETSVSPAAISRISEDSGAVIGGKLYSDSLGTPGENPCNPRGECYDVGTYLGMFKFNLDTIIESLK